MRTVLAKVPVFAWVGLLVLMFLWLFVGASKLTVTSDGIGYYDYLPSSFIHHDFNRYTNTSISDNRIDTLAGYINTTKGRIIKYPAGVSILLSPFFFTALIVEKITSNTIITGYESIFHNAVRVGAITYFFLSLWLFEEVLKKNKFSLKTRWISIAALGLATNSIQYINREAAFSHIYGQFLVGALMYVWIVRKQNYLNYFFIAVLFGLIYLTRPLDLLIITAIPFLSENFQGFKQRILNLFKQPATVLLMLAVVLLFVLLQSYLWFLQVGSFKIDTYSNEYFNFFRPHIIDVLISFKKGLLVYTPVLALVFIALLFFLINKFYYRFITSLFFLFVIVYVLSSWEVWWYNCGYGQRSFIDFYPTLFLIIALSVDQFNQLLKNIASIFVVVCVLLNQVQARQYRTHIINWEDMDKIKYWNVFLSNSNRFIGFNYKPKYNLNREKLIWAKNISSKKITENDSVTLLQYNPIALMQPNQTYLIKIRAYNNFNRNNRAKLKLVVNQNQDTLLSKEILFVNLTNTYLGVLSNGYYIFELPIKEKVPNLLSFYLKANNQSLELTNCIISLYKE
ncbi:MAG: hypothetical protein IT239_07520 [Bacteroidia bacterium]|nr:hypothetical protein [Bacteroidia bacterium]